LQGKIRAIVVIFLVRPAQRWIVGISIPFIDLALASR
jgi:hypothetical protein